MHQESPLEFSDNGPVLYVVDGGTDEFVGNDGGKNAGNPHVKYMNKKKGRRNDDD